MRKKIRSTITNNINDKIENNRYDRMIKNKELYAYVNIDSKIPHFDVIYHKSNIIAIVSLPAWEPLIPRVPEIQHCLQLKTIFQLLT